MTMAVKLRTLGIRVTPAIAHTVEELARQQGVSISRMGATLIEEALAARAGSSIDWRQRLEEQAQRALVKAMGRFGDLAAIAAFEASAHRLMYAQALVQELGPERAKQVSDKARKEAARRMRKSKEIISALLDSAD